MNDKREILHLDHLISIISSRSSHLDHLISIISSRSSLTITKLSWTNYIKPIVLNQTCGNVLLFYLNKMLSSKSSNRSRTMTTIKWKILGTVVFFDDHDEAYNYTITDISILHHSFSHSIRIHYQHKPTCLERVAAGCVIVGTSHVFLHPQAV